MYIAMNRFRIKKGSEAEFEQGWATRQSRLKEVPGFIEFQLLRRDRPEEEDITLFASYALWQSKEHFLDWTKSDHFRDAHKNAGERRALFDGPPQLEAFDVVLDK